MKRLFALIAICTLASAAPAAAVNDLSSPGEQALKTDRRGEVFFKSDARVLDLPLPRARYRIEHRLEGRKHFVTFTQIEGRNRVEADLQAEIQATPEAARSTIVFVREEQGVLQVQRVLVKGESCVHFF